MRALWLYPTLVLCSLGVVLAQNNNDTCDISLGDFDSVPQMCESLQQAAARIIQDVLNFTLADNGSIIFTSLPPARVVTLAVNDNSDGLKAWANLANAFVDSVRSGSLPYDLILPVLNSSLDNPIATASCRHSSSLHTGDGNFEFSDVLEDFGEWWAPILVVTVLGPVFALMFAIVGCCFCCCRLCGNCGGDLKQEDRDNNDLRCFILYIMLVLCVCLLFIGVVFAFVSNEKLNDSVQNFDNTVNSAIDNSLNFIDDTQMQANATVDRYDEINTFFQCQINNSHITLGGIVLDVFGDAVTLLINDSIELAVDLNNSIAGLRMVNTTVVKLLNLTIRLQDELNNLTSSLTMLQNDCNSIGAAVAAVCPDIPTDSYDVVDYSLVQDVTAVLNQLEQVGNLAQEAIEANATFYRIPCDIREQIQEQSATILDRAGEFRDTIRNIANDVERELRSIINEEGFIGDIRTQSSDIQDQLDEYDTPRYVISILICSLTLIVIVILIVGLALGAIGFRRKTDPSDRTPLSDYGGKAILYCGVTLMFIFAFVLLFLASITFFLGANMVKVCYSIAEDPPNDDIPSYELFSRIVDNNDLWGGSILGCFILDDSSIQLTVADMLNGCRANRAVYDVARLDMRPSLNLDEITNITNQLPDLEGLFQGLDDRINFDLDQVLNQNTRDSLDEFANAGLQGINYTTYITQITAPVSTLFVDSTISTLEMIESQSRGAGAPNIADDTQAIIDEIVRINQTTIAEIRNCSQLLEQEINMLNETAVLLTDRIFEVLDNANVTFLQLNSTNTSLLLANRSIDVFNEVVAFATDFADWAVNNLRNEIGRCQPLYATYSNLYYEACEDAVDGINGFWLAIGWCVLFFIPSLVFAVWLSHYLRRLDSVDYDQRRERLPMRDMKS